MLGIEIGSGTKWAAGILMAAAALTVLAGAAAASQSGDTYSGSGNWVINQPTTLSDEDLTLYGDILVYSTLTVTNAQISFAVADATFAVRAPAGGLTISPGAGSAFVGTTDAALYWSMVIENTTSAVDIQNVTLDHTRGGVQVTGGSASTRYFAFITQTHARGIGFSLTDSFATLLHLNVTLEMAPSLSRQETYNYNNYSQTARTPYYGYSYRYHYIYDYWTVSATGLKVTGGGPWVDGFEVHAPSSSPRIDFELTGGRQGFYDYRNQYKPGCDPSVWYSYFYWFNYTYHYLYPTIEFFGVDAYDTAFAAFRGVLTPPEDILFDVHYNIVGGYHYERDYCGVNPYYVYDNPDLAYSYNQLRWYTADVVGVHVRDGGLGNSFSDIQANMGTAGVLLTNDWGGSATYQNIWHNSYATFPTVMTFAFWSEENYALTTPAAVTATGFTLRDSRVSGAGVRFDRTYLYTPTSATVFRGDVVLDNVSVRGVAGLGLMVNISADAANSRPTYDYTARMSNSTFQGGRAFLLALPNAATKTSDYRADVLIENNRFVDSNMTPDPLTTSARENMDPCIGQYSYRYYFSTYAAVVSLDTGTHCQGLTADVYGADVVVRNNVWNNTTGPAFGWEYSDYTFAGGSSLTFEGNWFDGVRFFPTGTSGTPSTTDAMIKTVADNIAFSDNTFTDVDVAFGLLGGSTWGYSASNPAYYGFAYCPYRLASISYYRYYGYYGCSFPMKAPRIDVQGNLFERVDSPALTNGLESFFLLAGRGNLTFTQNTVLDSRASMVLVNLNYYSVKYPVEDAEVTLSGNTVSGQAGRPLMAYTDPYKAGLPVVIEDNLFRDASAPLFAWSWGYYTNLRPEYRPAENLLSLRLARNEFSNLSLGAGGAVHLTGRVTMVNNSWDGVVGWAAVVEHMSKIPGIAGNSVTNCTNGYWLEPVSSSGVRPTGTFADLTIRVADTAIRMVGGNLILQRMDFTGAQTGVDMRNGFAEVYSSKILVLSGRVQGDASIAAYNSVGYALRWANADGVDSGVPVANGLVVTSTPALRILSSSRTDAAGLVEARVVQVWKLQAVGSQTVVENSLPLDVLVSAGGLTQRVQLPQLAPGEPLTYFQDYASYPVLLRDPVVPAGSVGSPTEGEGVGSRTVSVKGYTFERGSGLAVQRLRLDGADWIAIPPAPTGGWSVPLEVAQDGPHTLEVEVADTAGNRQLTTRLFFVDVTAPALTVMAPLEETTLTNRLVYAVQGHVEPADADVTANGVPLVVTSRGDFFYNLTLRDGLNVLFLSARDRAGNEALAARAITFDRYPPFLQVTGPVDRLLTNMATIDVDGRAERGAMVTVNGVTAYLDPATLQFRLPNVRLDALFAQTENLLVIRATDAAGNIAYQNRTVVVDLSPPTIELELDPAVRARVMAGLPISERTIDVRGRTDSADARFTVAGQEVDLLGLTFSRVLVLAEGLNRIQVAASDDAGNERSVELLVVRDNVAPSLVLTRPGSLDVLTNRETLEVAGFTDQPGAAVTVTYLDARGVLNEDSVAAVAVGTPVTYMFEYTLALITDGNAHEVHVRASDAAGNFEEVAFTYTAKVNTPFLEVTGFKERAADTFVWINGTVEAGIANVTINGQAFPVVDQFFAVRWNLPIAEGNYSFTVSVRDEAGNQNTFRGTTQVIAGPASVAPAGAGSPALDSTAAVGAAMALLGAALAVLAMAVLRRHRAP